MWRPTLPLTRGAGDFSHVRNLVLILVWSALVVTAGCTQTTASRSSLEAKKAPTAMSARGSVPGNSPTPKTKPDQATQIDKTWPNELPASERSITPHSFEKEGYGL